MSYNPLKNPEIEAAKHDLSEDTSSHILNELRMQAMLVCAAPDPTMGAIETAFEIDRVGLVIAALKQIATEFGQARTAGGHKFAPRSKRHF